MNTSPQTLSEEWCDKFDTFMEGMRKKRFLFGSHAEEQDASRAITLMIKDGQNLMKLDGHRLKENIFVAVRTLQTLQESLS